MSTLGATVILFLHLPEEGGDILVLVSVCDELVVYLSALEGVVLDADQVVHNVVCWGV
jgi:hypothetical protein